MNHPSIDIEWTPALLSEYNIAKLAKLHDVLRERIAELKAYLNDSGKSQKPRIPASGG